MVDLEVYFNSDESFDGQALMIENLLTDRITLHLKNNLFLSETNHFINKATDILKRRYDIVNVNVHWGSIKKEGK
mgnify:FL=1